MKNFDRFEVVLSLGNAAMDTPAQIAQALRAAALRLERGEQRGKLMDLNGNSVGQFQFTREKGAIMTPATETEEQS